MMSFSVEDGVVGVMAMLSTSTTSFDLSCPATVSSALLGESGAGLPAACFSISRSSCIVDVVMITSAFTLLLLWLLLLVMVMLTEVLLLLLVALSFWPVRVLEKRLVALKSPINHRGFRSPSGHATLTGVTTADTAARPLRKLPSFRYSPTDTGPVTRGSGGRCG